MANPQKDVATLRKEFRSKYEPLSKNRSTIYKRDDFKCFYCKCKVITTSDLFSLMDELQENKLREFRDGAISEAEYLEYNPREIITKSSDYKKRMATLDHKIPLSKGGTNDEENLITCCNACNTKKGSIQLENGYTKIANELMEKLAKVKMSGQAWQVLFAIVRKLYGHNKKMDWIEYSQIMEITGLSKSRVCEAVSTLRESGIVTQKRNGKKQIIEIIKDFELVPQKRNVPLFRKHRSAKADNIVPLFSTTKESITKENIQKKTNTIPSGEKTKPERPQTEDVLRNKAIGEIIDAFKKTVNPEIDFGHKGHRNAAGRLVDAQGIEQAVAIAKYVTSPDYVSDQYAPTTTDPSALERNLPRIRVYALKKKNVRGGIAIIS